MNARKQLKELARLIGENLVTVRQALASLSHESLMLLAKHFRPTCRAAFRRVINVATSGLTALSLAGHLLEAALLPVGVEGTITTYVSSVDGDNGDDGLSWANAKATVAGALAVATDATFNFVYVDSAHAASLAGAISWDAATGGSFVAIISVNRSNGVWTAGASESISVNTQAINIASATRAFGMFVYGVTFSTNSGNSGVNDIGFANANTLNFANLEFQSCTFTMPGTSSTAQFLVGRPLGTASGFSQIVFSSCTFNTQSSTGQAFILQGGTITFINPTFGYAGGTKSATLFAFGGGSAQLVTIRDGDLSGFNSGNYFDVSSFVNGSVVVTNCKLHATPGLITGTWPVGAAGITVINTDSADTYKTFEFHNRLGSLTESATIYRDNGAQFDGAGIGWQIVTSANCTEQTPFITPWIHRWHDGTSSVALSLEQIFDNATDSDNRTCWAEFEVLENASFPVSTLTSTRNAQPFDGSGVALTSSSEAWTGAGGFSNSKKRVISVTRTPAEKSLLRARLSVGRASFTTYLDPCLVIAGADDNPPVRWDENGAHNEGVAAAASGGGVPANLSGGIFQ